MIRRISIDADSVPPNLRPAYRAACKIAGRGGEPSPTALATEIGTTTSVASRFRSELIAEGFWPEAREPKAAEDKRGVTTPGATMLRRSLAEAKAVMERLAGEGHAGDYGALAAALDTTEIAARERRRQLFRRGVTVPGWESGKYVGDDGLTPTRRRVRDAARRLIDAGHIASDLAIAVDTGLDRSTVRFHRQWLEGRGLWPKEEGEEEAVASSAAATPPAPPRVAPGILRLLPSHLRRALDAANVLDAMGVRPCPITIATVARTSPLEASIRIRALMAAGAWPFAKGEDEDGATSGPDSPPLAPSMANPEVPVRYSRSAFDDPESTARKAAWEMIANDRPDGDGRPKSPTLAAIVAGYIEEWRSGKVADLDAADDSDVSEAA